MFFNNTQSSSNEDAAPSDLPRPYLSKNPLTKTEAIFYQRLIESLPDLTVLAQVPLSSFMKVDTSQINRKNFKKYFSPISQQSVDYLICRKDFSIITAVELDDKTHLNKDAKIRDDKKNRNLAAANVPLIRWHVESMPNHDTIKQKFFEYTHKKDNTQQQDFVWGAREQQHYFTYPKKKSTPLFHYIGVKLIFLGLAAWFISSVIHNLSTKLGQPQMQAIQAAAKQMLPTSSAVVLSTDVQQPTPVRNNKLQQPMEDEQSINESKIQEAALKENIWNRDFINKGECLASDSIVDCGNKHIRNRNNFEQFWNAKKTKFSTQP